MAPNSSGDECRHLRGSASAEDDGGGGLFLRVQSLRRMRLSPNDATQIGAECCVDGEVIRDYEAEVSGESKRERNTGFSSEIGTKLRESAVRQAGGSCYS